MPASTRLPGKSALFVSALLGSVIFTSCASVPQTRSKALPPSTGNTVNQAAPAKLKVAVDLKKLMLHQYPKLVRN